MVDSIVIENAFKLVAFVQVTLIIYLPGKSPFSTVEVQVSPSSSNDILITSLGSGYQ